MEKLFEKYHSLIFSSLSVIGLEAVIYLYYLNGRSIYILSSSVLFILFIVEAISSFRFALERKTKLPLPHIVDNVKHIHISHHIILPIFLYLGIFGFIFFNKLSFASEVIILLGGITFFSIFQGARSSFLKEFSFDETLHYIYDSIKIIIFFLAADIILQSQIYYGFNKIITFIAVDIIAFCLFLLIIIRKSQANVIGLVYIFVSSLIVSGITIILATHFNILSVSLIGAVIYYLFIGFIHHKLNATLTPSIIGEYLLMAAIIILAIRGIS